MGWLDGILGGDEDNEQTVKSEPWSKAQPYLLDLLKQAQLTYQNQPMRSWGMLSPAERMQYAQGYYGADMLGAPMPGYQPPPPGPTATQPQPTAPQPPRQSQEPGAPQNLPTKDWLKSQSSANFSAPVMVWDPSDGIVMYKGDGSGGWMRDIGAIARPSSGRGGSGAEESGRASTSYAANQGGGMMSGGPAAPSMPGLSAGPVAQQGPTSMAPGGASGGYGGMLGGIMGGMLGLAAGGPMGAIGGAMAGNRFGNWMGGR